MGSPDEVQALARLPLTEAEQSHRRQGENCEGVISQFVSAGQGLSEVGAGTFMVTSVERQPANMLSGLSADQAELSADSLVVPAGADQPIDPGQVSSGQRANRGTPEAVVEAIQRSQPFAQVSNGIRSEVRRSLINGTGGGDAWAVGLFSGQHHRDGGAARGEKLSAVHGT
jgi:hypothetical protein